MNTNSIEVIDRGLHCLSTNLGAKETEVFISTLLREKFDYTNWRQSLVDRIKDFDDLDNLLQQTKDSVEFEGQADIIL